MKIYHQTIINILISQSVPLNPLGQMQSYDAIPSTHLPPLLHGFSMQSSISKKIPKHILVYPRVTKCITHNFNMLIQCWRMWLNILMLQSSPMKPWGQWHEKELIPSSHWPSFLQGLFLQSSMSARFTIVKCFSKFNNLDPI